MTKIISITNLKGGVSKTTSTANIGAALARMGYKALLVDWDPQANLSLHFGFEDDGELKTLFGALDPKAKGYHDLKKLHAYPVEQYPENLFLLANNFTLSQFEGTFTANLPGYQQVLKKVLDNFIGKVDFILIDTQPSLSVLTINAYCASQYLLLPMESDKFSERGLDQIIHTVAQIDEFYNTKIKIAGVFFGRHKPTTVISKNYEAYFKTERPEIPLMKSMVRDMVAIKECKEMGMDIFSYDNMMSEKNKKVEISNGSEDFYNLANELLFNIGEKKALELARDLSSENGSARKANKGTFNTTFQSFINP